MDRPTPEQWSAKLQALKKVGNQLEGPCPLCGGDNRFHVKLAAPYLFGCRSCEETNKGYGTELLRAVFGRGNDSKLPRRPKEDFTDAVYHHPDGRQAVSYGKDWPGDWDTLSTPMQTRSTASNARTAPKTAHPQALRAIRGSPRRSGVITGKSNTVEDDCPGLRT